MRVVDHSVEPRTGKDGVPNAIVPNPPVNEMPATPEELIASQRLCSVLDAEFPLESGEDLDRRRRVIDDLTELVREWIREVCVAKGMAEEEAADHKGRLYVSGSFRLGVHGKGTW